MAQKKAPAKVAVKKTVTPKVTANKKGKTIGDHIIQNEKDANAISKKTAKAKVTLTSFTIKAIIPTMMYGNIMPEITVKALSLQEANDFCMPYIKGLYEQYAEAPRDGKDSKMVPFKPNVTAKERTVAPQVVTPTGPAAPTPAGVPILPKAPTIAVAPANESIAKEILNSPAPAASNAVSFEKSGAIKKAPIDTSFIKPATAEESEAYIAAEKAISDVLTMPALDLIQKKVADSGKLSSNEKDRLYTIILKKRSEVK